MRSARARFELATHRAPEMAAPCGHGDRRRPVPGARGGPPARTAAWLLIGLGVLAWAFGELYFTVVLWNDSAPPVPSPADGGYLSLPPLIFVGLILLARSRIKGLPKTIWADGVTAGPGRRSR